MNDALTTLYSLHYFLLIGDWKVTARKYEAWRKQKPSQLLGMARINPIHNLGLNGLLQLEIPLLLFGQIPYMVELKLDARDYGIPVLRSNESTQVLRRVDDRVLNETRFRNAAFPSSVPLTYRRYRR